MSLTHSPSIVTNGLVMYYDMINTAKSSVGAPTTNISTGIGIGAYLNTPSDVTSSLTVTSETYKGQPVYKQVLTPITATGVSYLTNAGNPGIGVVTGGGGGAAARFTGHSIFFKPAVDRSGLNASTPIYTHYSNIGGWQSTGNYDDMGDGWYRAHVIFYSAGGGSDGKYWAINPAGATLGVPITIYWAAPFKEDRNDSTHVSPYVNDTRSNTQSILDLTGNNTVTANSLTYASDSTFSFNGTNSVVTSPSITLNLNAGVSMEMIFRSTDIQSRSQGYMSFSPAPQYVNFYSAGTGALRWETWQNAGSVGGAFYGPTNLVNNTWYHAVGTYSSDGASRLYINGIQVGSATYAATSYGSLTSTIRIGEYAGHLSGSISTSKIYNRALSAAEVQQNFNALRGRYGL